MLSARIDDTNWNQSHLPRSFRQAEVGRNGGMGRTRKEEGS